MVEVTRLVVNDPPRRRRSGEPSRRRKLQGRARQQGQPLQHVSTVGGETANLLDLESVTEPATSTHLFSSQLTSPSTVCVRKIPKDAWLFPNNARASRSRIRAAPS